MDAALAALGSLDGTVGASRRKHRHFSAATRARMTVSQRARWAKGKRFGWVREQSKNSPKRVMSLAARRKVAGPSLKGGQTGGPSRGAENRLVPFVFRTAISRASLRND